MSAVNSSTSGLPRVAVVGVGITGLAAAYRLLELAPHVEVQLFESAARPGGVLETIDRNGFLIERSADNFLSKLTAGVDLCRRLGLANELLPTDDTRRRAFVVRSGRLVPIPDGFYLMSPRKLGSLLLSPLLSPAGKLRLLAERLVPARSSDMKDESVASFVTRRFGRETFERLVQPLVAGIYTADPTKLSMAATMPEFFRYEREQGSLLRATLGTSAAVQGDSASGARYGLFVAPRKGMGELVSALVDKLPIGHLHFDSPVRSISREGGSAWRLVLGMNSSAASVVAAPFDFVILALPAFAAAELLPGVDADLAAELAGIEYSSCAVISLGYSRSHVGHPLDGFGFVVPHVEGRRIIAGSFASRKFPGRAPDDSVLIRVFMGGALQPDLLKLDDVELQRIASDELAELLQITGEARVVDVARWPRSMPQYHVGHLARIERIERLAGALPSLALAGNAYHGVGIPQCIASGEAAAERVAKQFA